VLPPLENVAGFVVVEAFAVAVDALGLLLGILGNDETPGGARGCPFGGLALATTEAGKAVSRYLPPDHALAVRRFLVKLPEVSGNPLCR
jgi:hypothetical protein